jgi:hypothetical protein
MRNYKNIGKTIVERPLNESSNTFTSNLFDLVNSIELHQQQIKANRERRFATKSGISKPMQNVKKT